MKKMDKGVERARQGFRQGIVDDVKSQLGIDTDITKWYQCVNGSQSYLQCPISNSTSSKKGDSGEFYVAIHNPAEIEQEVAVLQVPSGDYNASVWDIKM